MALRESGCISESCSDTRGCVDTLGCKCPFGCVDGLVGCTGTLLQGCIIPHRRIIVESRSMLVRPERVVLFDVRCLQDENYRDRGVGRLSVNLVGSARRFLSRGSRTRLIGITDPALPPLERRFRDHLDEVLPHGYLGRLAAPTWFLQLSPMTHDPLFIHRIVETKEIFKAAIVYDFIPLRMSDQYLPRLSQKLDYQAKLLLLARYDHFFPISDWVADELVEATNVPISKVSRTAGPILPALLQPREQPGETSGSSNYVLVTGGWDPRKNVECAITAHAESQSATGGSSLVILGQYPERLRESLCRLHVAHGGMPGSLSFVHHISDAELAALYRNALCVVVPSRMEGFSLPVIEAMALGTPVFASSIPPHIETIENPAYLFPPDDDTKLRSLLASIHADPQYRAAMIGDQSSRWQRFQHDRVAHAFWDDFEARASKPTAALVGGRRPQLAIMTPVPPDRSGVADYTAATIKTLAKHADIHVFTPTKSPAWPDGATTLQPLSALPHISQRYDRAVSIVGNSSFHLEIFHLLVRYGGACIEHDNRLLGFYCLLLGMQRGREVAESEMRRRLEPGEIERWLHDEATLEATFLGELARISDPLCVHSRETARVVRDRFGVAPVHLPFCIYRDWHADELTAACRAQARSRLGIPSDEVAVISFGYVVASKAPEECIWAVSMLRGWGIPAKLYFVGAVLVDQDALVRLCDSLDMSAHVRFLSAYTDERTYRDYLLAADLCLQLRTHLLGGVSGALSDCIAAGLPGVANTDLADAIESPSYVVRVPDRLSPMLIAEALAAALELRSRPRHLAQERQAYSDTHNFAVYAERLCEALSLPSRRRADVA
ncbi:MAG: glycosyltransferase [Bradyrhizobium sp.]